MSTTISSAAAATSTGCGTASQYELPLKDASCGVPNNNHYHELMSKCSNSAPVVAYDDDCALYSLAVGQSVQNLTDCLYKEGVAWKDVWCFGSTNATATATVYPTAASTSTEGSTSTTGSTSTRGSKTTKSSATSSSTDSAAISNQRPTSKSALAVCFVLLLTAVAGVSS